MTAVLTGMIAVSLAAGLDWLIGDPRRLLHPVVVMGWLINHLRKPLEHWAGDRPWKLRAAGGLICLVLLGCSGTAGWAIERLALDPSLAEPIGWLALLIGLASALAGRSLHASVLAILTALANSEDPDHSQAKEKLSWIVGRDVQQLDEQGILRAATESAAENAVDGLFAPLLWMSLGAWLWWIHPALPGPLSMVWMFKGASTMDSMLGYRIGRLRWIGTVGARLDDLLVWLPCRLVMVTLPLVSRPWWQWSAIVQASERDGAMDPSPNAGRSEAVYAHCIGVRLGGRNRYGRRWVDKPDLAKDQQPPQRHDVFTVLKLNQRLELCWIATGLLVSGLIWWSQ